jgi:hypothetical protein
MKFLISGLVGCFVLAGCVQSDYTRMVRSELAKGVRHDSILLGINFGDSQEAFRERCFALNKQHLTMEGPGFYVQYFILDSAFHDRPTSIRLLFQPSLDDKNVITDMDMKFNYTGWAPWNRQYQSDSLKVKVIQMLELWYKGNKFVTANNGKEEIPVKVDGNRRILIYEDKPQTVIVKVQNILHPKFIDTVK